ncbi:hypothetical protein Staley_89 [Bacillus phage Staley]|uniref:Uncharacterized protein n=1 Tax=Bacillus phage Staley TaxID=1406792 RepID=U5Q1C9_9CAUD|nr:hypothetical protein Staley_89 [Bacillus phage Staley]AGY48772.1 hypothetical protein Staley_89 [Bacillus phage Staley]
MTVIPLISQQYKVTAIKAKTKAHFFEHIDVGDILEFQMFMSHSGRGRSGTYASDVLTINVSKEGMQTYKTQSQLSNILDRCFELQLNSI